MNSYRRLASQPRAQALTHPLLERLDQHRHEFTTRHGLVSVIDIGAGPIAMFIHGAGPRRSYGDTSSPRPRGRSAAASRSICRCTDTPRPAPGSDLVSQRFAELVTSVTTEVGASSVDVVANDTGGAVAQVFAALADTLPRVTDVIELPGVRPFFPDERSGELVPLLVDHWAHFADAASGRTRTHDAQKDATFKPTAFSTALHDGTPHSPARRPT